MPSSLPNKMISGRGFSFVQLVMAFHWMIPICPLNAFGMENNVSISEFPCSTHFRSQQQMPAEPPLHGTKCRRRHPPQVPLFYIPMLHVIGDAVRKNMIDFHLLHAESVPLEQGSPFLARVGIRNRAARLGLRIPRY